MSQATLAQGIRLQEYRIERVLGAGGFGLTYLANDENLNLRVALKEYLPNDIALRAEDNSVRPRDDSLADAFAWGRQRFLDESRTLASFRHPNIVRVMRFFEANSTAYMVMEFVEGDALPDWIKSRRPLDEAQVRGVIVPLLQGLSVVHGAGYLHRDIKPGNIFMRSEGGPVLLDFGSARQKRADTELTAIVSPGYAPFEQYHETGNQGPWSDLYAIGGVMYWMVTGQRPTEAAGRVRTDAMPPAVQLGDRGRYGLEFLAAIDWALAPHEEQRPQSVPELVQALGGGSTPATEKTAVNERTVKAAPAPAPAFSAETLEMLEKEIAQHLGPIANVVVKNAAKKASTYAALVQVLAAEIPEGAARARFEKRYGERSQPPSRPPATVGSGGPATALAQARFPADTLDRAERRLAEHIGALARVVVKRAALKARTESELYLLLADEISDKDEKKAFIRKAISVSGKP
jgi:serine/threonine protein kinase